MQINKLVLLAILVAMPLGASASRPRDVLAHGVDQEDLWVALVAKSIDASEGDFRTTVQVRDSGSADRWVLLPRISARVVSLAHYGPTLAALLDDGQWLLVDDEAISTGKLIPGAPVCLAGGKQDLWAISALPGGIKSVTTQPTSRPAPATTASTTTAASKGLSLLRLDRRKWIGVADLPQRWGDAQAVLSVMVENQEPIVAMSAGKNEIQILCYRRSGQWDEMGTVRPGFAPTDAKLLNTNRGLRLWVASDTGPGVLSAWKDGQWSSPVALQLPGELSANDQRAVAYAFERIRLIFTRGGKLYEQCYDPADGKKVDDPAEVMAGRTPSPQMPVTAVQLISLGLLIVVLIATFRRGFGNKPSDED